MSPCHLCSAAFLVAFICICDSKLDLLPDCIDRICTCDSNDNSVDDVYDKYTVVIDAGSVHTSVHLYGMSPPNLPQEMEAVWDMTCGISEFVNDTQGLKDCLKPMIHNVSLKVPPCKLCQTPVFLGATAGMRNLNHTNPPASYQFMEEVEKILNNSGFCYKSGNAKILKGSEEGGLSWVAANSMFGSGPNKTKGALNFGGGSSEIAFECRDKCGNVSNTENAEVLPYHICGKDHNVFSKCNKCYGLKEAMHRFLVLNIWENYIVNGMVIENPIANPCLKSELNSNNKTHNFPTKKSDIFNGYCTGPHVLVDPHFKNYINTLKDDYEFDLVGNWNKNKCNTVIEKLINDRCKQIFKEACFDKPFQGLWDNSDGSIAMGAYFTYFSQLFNSTNDIQNTTMKEVENEIERICNESTNGIYTDCFAVSYIFEMLTKGYGFDAESFKNFVFTDKVDWPYGYVVINNNN